ncbi:VOC family protein [Phytoactinopolyspora mesophila]|uniref:Glyoxalase n=1 Tax=Phytoactinopolyspora mesophila TaxID=2650750 RepID=A0A7K3MBG7_9ACTN|nr:VOC family protein [Phytoactinopolyspora mesophila]NDL60659.1 glyoxalase [Phytoactinopolyspora mesophila]
MAITHVRTLNVPVSDQDRAKAFYTESLGFHVVVDNSMGPMRWLEVAPHGAATSIVLGAHPDMIPGSQQGILLTTNDIDRDCEQLRAAGVSVDGPEDQPWGRQASFTDPDGNGFLLSAA